MKKWIKWFCASLIALVAVLCTSCHRPNYEQDESIGKEDISYVKAALIQIDNPQFNSVDGVIAYQKEQQCIRYQDSVFYSMPDEIVTQVTQVLLNKGKTVTKRTIVNEFLQGEDIYMNLHKPKQYSARIVEKCDSVVKPENE